MVAHVLSVTFNGIDVVPVDVQVKIASGMPSFTIVGLPDKSVNESKERVRAAITAIGLSLPAERITINLAPSDVLKEGAHYDLPIALGLMVCLGLIQQTDIDDFVVVGELSLDGRISSVSGVLPAAIFAQRENRGIICPHDNGAEATWASEDMEVVAAPHLMSLAQHLKNQQQLPRPMPHIHTRPAAVPDLKDVRGQLLAKRALEIAAAGGHNMLMIGPPGAGKSMLAQRLPGLLPPLTSLEALEISMIHSLAGHLKNGDIIIQRPYRDPHHSASLPALIGGGLRAKPGEISLAHHGVLFLDELPEFQRATLEALRQPLETRQVTIARANAHVSYPANIQLVAAMNPCRCGHLMDAAQACRKAPLCGEDYMGKLSGPLLDRFDIVIEVPAVPLSSLSQSHNDGESTATVAARVATARSRQQHRYASYSSVHHNADASPAALDETAQVSIPARTYLEHAAQQLRLSARGFHRIIRVGRTIADLAGSATVEQPHIAEALNYRQRTYKPLAQTSAR